MKETVNSWSTVIDELIGYGVVNSKTVEKCDCPGEEHHEMVRLSDKFIKCMAESYNMIVEKADEHPDVLAKYEGKIKITDIEAIMIVALVKYFGNNGKGIDKQTLEEYSFVLGSIPKEALQEIEVIVKREAERALGEESK